MRETCLYASCTEHCCIDRASVDAYTRHAKPEESHREHIRLAGTRLAPSGGTHSMMRGMAKVFLAIAAVVCSAAGSGVRTGRADRRDGARLVRSADAWRHRGGDEPRPDRESSHRDNRFERRSTALRTCRSAPTRSSFSLSGFTKQERDEVVLTSGFTANVNATMASAS